MVRILMNPVTLLFSLLLGSLRSFGAELLCGNALCLPCICQSQTTFVRTYVQMALP